MGENKEIKRSASWCKLVQGLAVGAVAVCLCGCGTTDAETGEPTVWGEVLTGAKETCAAVAGFVVANPEQSATALEWVGGTLTVCGLGGIGAAFLWAGNKLRKVCVKKPAQCVAQAEQPAETGVVSTKAESNA